MAILLSVLYCHQAILLHLDSWSRLPVWVNTIAVCTRDQGCLHIAKHEFKLSWIFLCWKPQQGKKLKTAIARIHIILRKMCPSTPLKLRNCQLTLKDKTAKTTHISYISDFSFLISRSKQLPKLRDSNPSKIHSFLNFKISHRFSCSVGTLHWCNQFLLLWFHQSPLTEIRYAWAIQVYIATDVPLVITGTSSSGLIKPEKRF